MSLIAILLVTTGFLSFALGSRGLHRRWISREPDQFQRLGLKIAGWSMLAIAFPVQVLSDGWIFGSIAWFGDIMLGAGVVFLSVNYGPTARRAPDIATGRCLDAPSVCEK